MTDTHGELAAWGWTQEQFLSYQQHELCSQSNIEPGRIVSQREDTFQVVTATGVVWAHPAGVLFHRSTTQERPGVGDWVLLEAADFEITDEVDTMKVTHSVVHVLPRKSCFLREAPGGRGEAQVVACNVDKVFVVNPADDLNLNRLERFAVAIASGGAIPAVILSKGDLVSEQEMRQARDACQKLWQEVEVYLCSDVPRQREVVHSALSTAFQSGCTYALVGASGVGKSTLVNALMREQVQETGAVREGDGKGRHVTTFRELFPLANGALLMDTPGVREFAMWSEGDGLDFVFSDIREYQDGCRFADCSHQSEPGCEVKKAVNSGKLSQRRLDNWRALSQELVQNEERQERLKCRRERSDRRRKVQRDKRFSR